MRQRAIKRGDDFPVNLLRVRNSITGALLSNAAIVWKLYNRTNTLISNGSAVLLDAATARFQFHVPKTITTAFELLGEYRLDVVMTHSAIQVTKSVTLVAVDKLPL